MSHPRVLVLHNEPTLPAGHPDADSEHDILYTADVVCRILQTAGLPVSRLGITYDPDAVIRGIRSAKPDVVFNLYEGTAGWGNAEPFVTGIIDLLGLPYTGSPPQPLILCRSKPLTKRLLAGADLPTARFQVYDQVEIADCRLNWPVIVKPGMEDASVGIDQNSVATNQAELESRIRYLREHYGPLVLVEELLRGREFNVGVIVRDGQPRTLPFSEILFVPPETKPDLWPIVSFDAKWRPDTTDFVATPAVNPAEVTPELQAAISGLCIRAFEMVGCRDYARVDLRLDQQEQPYILEVNPNPCISPLAGLAAGLESAQLPYPEFILGLVREALRRGQSPELAGKVPTGAGTADEPKINIGPVEPAAAVDPVGQPAQSSEWQVRLLAAEDLAAVRELLGEGRPTEATVPGELRLVAQAVDGIVGYLIATELDSGEAVYSLQGLYVQSDRRRKGCGTALLQLAERELARSGVRLLYTELSSGPEDGVARQFLRHLDYLQTGDVPEYYRDGTSQLQFAKLLPTVSEPAEERPTAETNQSAPTDHFVPGSS